MSSMLSAPATIPAPREVTFNPAFAPRSVGTLRCSSGSWRSPACCANASNGTNPAEAWGQPTSAITSSDTSKFA